jgi:hypothetical protein
MPPRESSPTRVTTTQSAPGDGRLDPRHDADGKRSHAGRWRLAVPGMENAMLSIQSEVRALLRSRSEAIWAKDIDRLMSFYSPTLFITTLYRRCNT